MSKFNTKTVYAIVGPTASGKTALAVQLAKKLNTQIISADSRLVYKGLNIGTAKPSLAERDGVEHYLIDIVEPNRSFSLANYLEKAENCLLTTLKENNCAVVAGGTGFYLRGLLEGLKLENVP
ncbi:MAG TPA: isopentenyl transferase family protein, partial [Vampirovibrionales bacterium]